MRAITLLPFAALASIFLLPLPSSAGEGFESVAEQGAARGTAEKPEKQRSDQVEKEEKYRRLLQAYEGALNEAESDEERDRLFREFQKETEEYREALTEKEKRMRDRSLGEKRRRLEGKHRTDKRLLRQDYIKKSRRIDGERDSRLSGLFENWAARERALEQKQRQLEEDHRKRMKALERRYREDLRKLE